MREIKFRAWSKKHKMMFSVGGLINMDYQEHNEYRYVTIAGRDAGAIPDATPQILGIELMQYTGLKDKNGKEIYEGDIVQEYDKRLKDEIIGVYKITYYKNGFYLDDGLHSNWDAENIDVIGNIYENPELLT